MKKSRPILSASHRPENTRRHTRNQTLHLILPLNVHVESLLQLIVVQVGTTPRSHHTQLILRRAIELPVFLVQLADKVDAQVNAMGFEVNEVQPAAIIRRVQLPSKIDQLGQRSANLEPIIVSPSILRALLLLHLRSYAMFLCGEITAVVCGGGTLTSTATWLTTPV